MDDAAFEGWAKVVVEQAAALIAAELRDARESKTARASRAGRGYMSRYVHFRHPSVPADRAVWLFAVPAGHPYDFRPPHARVGAGLMQDAKTELSSSRFAAGMTKGFPFSWKVHLDARYEGYRLAIKVEPERDSAEARAEELAAEVLRGLRNAGLLPG